MSARPVTAQPDAPGGAGGSQPPACPRCQAIRARAALEAIAGVAGVAREGLKAKVFQAGSPEGLEMQLNGWLAKAGPVCVVNLAAMGMFAVVALYSEYERV